MDSLQQVSQACLVPQQFVPACHGINIYKQVIISLSICNITDTNLYQQKAWRSLNA